MSRAAVRRLLISGAVLVLALGAGACTPDHELSDAELYSKYCSECHGADGRGDEDLIDGGQEVNLRVSRHIADGDREFVRRRIAYGYKQMPAYRDKVEPATLERLVELTMRLAREDTGLLSEDERAEDPTRDPTKDPTEDPTEDADHGPKPTENGLPEARSAR